MERRIFGNTRLSVSILGFGAGHIGSEPMDESMVGSLLNGILDMGVNFIDTARAYGISEQRIGKFIAHRRKEFILSTKVGYDVQWKPDWTFDSVIRGVEEALIRMKTDYIDIVHLHSCSRVILEQGDVIDALEKAKKEGKTRFIAYSGENDALDYAIASGRFDSIQCSVNLFDQRVIGRQLLLAEESGLGVIAKRPIGNAPWRFEIQPTGHYCEPYWLRWKKMKLDPGETGWNELAIRFATFTPGVSTSIAGTSRIEHFRELAKAVLKGPLDKEWQEKIRDAFQANDDQWSGQI